MRRMHSITIIISLQFLICHSQSNDMCTQIGNLSYNGDRCTITSQDENGQEIQFQRHCRIIPQCMPGRVQIRDCCPFCDESDVLTFTENTGGYSDYQNHPCKRTCMTGQPMTCKYTFTVNQFETSTQACFRCPFRTKDCNRRNCNQATGISRLVITTNKMTPGPAIQVCVGDTIVVDVRNRLLSQSLTMHWHGLPQRNTQYYDGVPFITQCPIVTRDTFRYVFSAEQWGTYFYHPHTGAQITDGCAGPIIIRQPDEENALRSLYDEDCYRHIMLVMDWTNLYSEDFFTREHYSGFRGLPSTILVNGKGRIFSPPTIPLETTANSSQTAEDKLSRMPFAEFIVQQGKRYRFRMINAASFVCPFSISIDNHNLTVIATDGFDVEPTTVTSIISNPAERYDFVISADQAVDKYWIRVNAIAECRPEEIHQLAILRYEGSSDGDPTASMGYVEPAGVRVGNVVENDVNPEDLKLSDLRSLEPLDEGIDTDTPDYQFYVELAENLIPYSFLTPFPEVPPVPTFQLNHISLDLPPTCLLTQPYDPNAVFCNETTLVNSNCNVELCLCVYVLQARLNSIVEVIMYINGDEPNTPDHPMHFHGYTYRVLAQERAYNITKERLQEMDANGELNRNFDMPTAKDTVIVYNPGYTIFRFNASNPGIWLLHCHQQFHLTMGMGLFIKVGEQSDLPPVPPNLPLCRNYQPT